MLMFCTKYCKTCKNTLKLVGTVPNFLFLFCNIFQVGFNINLDNIGNPDSAFPSAISKALQGMQAGFQNPFWKFQISMFPFQNSTIAAVKYLRNFAKEVIEQRCSAWQNGEETPKDILEHILKEAKENSELDMEDLVDNFLTIFIAGLSALKPGLRVRCKHKHKHKHKKPTWNDFHSLVLVLMLAPLHRTYKPGRRKHKHKRKERKLRPPCWNQISHQKAVRPRDRTRFLCFCACVCHLMLMLTQRQNECTCSSDLAHSRSDL